MNDNFFLDRDGTPLTGKIPLQISLQGDCSALRSQANSELTTFLTDLRLSGLPQMRRTTQLIGGTMEMVHTYGVTQVTLVAVAKEDKLPSDFFGGFIFTPKRSDNLPFSTVSYSGKTSSLPGRPAYIGSPDNPAISAETTDAVIVQVHPTLPLGAGAIKRGAVRIFRTRAVRADAVELPTATKKYLISHAHTGGNESVGSLGSLYLGGVLLARWKDFASPSFGATGASTTFIVTHGVPEVPPTEAAKVSRGLVFFVSPDSVRYVDLSDLARTVTVLYTGPQHDSSQVRLLPLGVTDTRTVAGGTTTITLAGSAAGAQLSSCTITITTLEGGAKQVTASVTQRFQDFNPGNDGTRQQTSTVEQTMHPQAVHVDSFVKGSIRWKHVEGDPTNLVAEIDGSAPVSTRQRYIGYKAYGVSYSVTNSYSFTPTASESGVNWFTGGAYAPVTTTQSDYAESSTLQVNTFKGYHYRLRGMFPRLAEVVASTGSVVQYVDIMEEGIASYAPYSPYWFARSQDLWASGGYSFSTAPSSPNAIAAVADPLFAPADAFGLFTVSLYLDAAGGTYQWFDPFTPPGDLPSAYPPTDTYTYLRAGNLYCSTMEHSAIASGPKTTPWAAMPTMSPGVVQPDYQYLAYGLTSTSNGFDPNAYDGDGNLIPGYTASYTFDIDTSGVPGMRVRTAPATIAELYPGSPANRGTYNVLKDKVAAASIAYPGFSDTPLSYYLHFPPFPFASQIGGGPSTQIHGVLEIPGTFGYYSDSTPIAAYPKRAAVFGFTETFTASGGGWFSDRPRGSITMTRSGDLVANEHLAEWIPTNVDAFPALTPITASATVVPAISAGEVIADGGTKKTYFVSKFDPTLALRLTKTTSANSPVTGRQYDYGSPLPIEFMSLANRFIVKGYTSRLTTVAALVRPTGAAIKEVTTYDQTTTQGVNYFPTFPITVEAFPEPRTYLPLLGEEAAQLGYYGPQQWNGLSLPVRPLLRVGYWGDNATRNEFPTLAFDPDTADSVTSSSTSFTNAKQPPRERIYPYGPMVDHRFGTYIFWVDDGKGVYVGNKNSCVALIDIFQEWIALGSGTDTSTAVHPASRDLFSNENFSLI